MAKPKIYTLTFSKVYPMYVQKAERKERKKEEVDEIIRWLTGYSQEEIDQLAQSEKDFEAFFQEAPKLNPNAPLIKGVVCGIRVEEIEDPITQQIRYLDKLVDELAKGKKMEKILR